MVEDNPGDVDLTREALDAAHIVSDLQLARDGEEALCMLRGIGRSPDLIFLDLNLPRISGFEVLAQIKADPNLRRIPVIILTSSAAERDVTRGYDLHANAYVVKPVCLQQFFAAIRSIEQFWASVVRLPQAAG